MATPDNPYRVLGVSSSATQAEIQAAYKRRARELHPDVNSAPDAEDQFKKLVQAYDLLKDERRRARYDAFGGRRGRRSGSRRARDFTGVRFEDVRTGTDDLRSSFDEFLKRARERPRGREGPALKVHIDLRAAYQGTTIEVTPPGRRSTEPVRLKVPPGAKSGDRLTLADRGLVVVLQIDPPEGVTLDGRDVHMGVAITPWEAALGSTIEFQAPHRSLRVRIPESTSSGKVLRIRGQGLPQKPGRSGPPGDLYVDVRINIPPELSPEERELFERLAEISDFDARSG